MVLFDALLASRTWFIAFFIFYKWKISHWIRHLIQINSNTTPLYGIATHTNHPNLFNRSKNFSKNVQKHYNILYLILSCVCVHFHHVIGGIKFNVDLEKKRLFPKKWNEALSSLTANSPLPSFFLPSSLPLWLSLFASCSFFKWLWLTAGLYPCNITLHTFLFPPGAFIRRLN